MGNGNEYVNELYKEPFFSVHLWAGSGIMLTNEETEAHIP